MKYIFVVNGREGRREAIDADLGRQLQGLDIEFSVYHTVGIGDGIRYVRIYCDLHRDEEVCFVACGGSGTLNEAMSGIVGFKNKSLAFLAYGSTNDFTKYYPDHDFTSLQKILDGQTVKIDVIKANNSYSMNVINIGFDSFVAGSGIYYIDSGMDGAKAYRRSLLECILFKRRNAIQVIADGEVLNKRSILQCTLGNAKYCGGQYLCSPRAVVDDGLIEVCLFKTCSLLTFLRLMLRYEKGQHLDDKFCLKHLVYRQAKHIELRSRNLITICLDGEMMTDIDFDIDILPKAVDFVLPEN